MPGTRPGMTRIGERNNTNRLAQPQITEKHRLHSQAVLGKLLPRVQLSLVRTANLASRPNPRSTQAKPKGDYR
jgi:hypothetical protein